MVRTESAFALEMQHLAPIVIERVNTYYGWRCIGRIVLKQGPVRGPEKNRPVMLVLSDADRQRVTAATQPIEEEGLRLALDRLGQAIIGQPSASRTKA